ncbi:hypothetical protein [Brevibacillus gelatini]|uniref:hypothetical protein n=1 Tax=Brevibacillus gelatini TaxID=1655277 RepID=UPI001474EE29|nr:hypothetical protein [Brevibacillus gelatini]
MKNSSVDLVGEFLFVGKAAAGCTEMRAIMLVGREQVAISTRDKTMRETVTDL